MQGVFDTSKTNFSKLERYLNYRGGLDPSKTNFD
jgi:hypothetical protein